MTDPLVRLEALVAERARAGADASYTARLLSGGMPLIARKLGEEAIEVVVAAMAGEREPLLGEVADLLYHLAVLLRIAAIDVADVAAELARREGQSGLVEKAAREKAVRKSD